MQINNNPSRQPRHLPPAEITRAVADLCIDANVNIGEDIRAALRCAKVNETSQLAQSTIEVLLKNAEIAEQERLPICQDTGMAVVFVTIGAGIYVNGDITEAINEGVRQGYREGYCRNSVVSDPIHRKNTGDNTPAVIHYDFDPALGDKIKITVAPKGFGSENMSAIKMLNPSDGLKAAEDFVVETVKKAGANPCPPIIVGVGIGGTMEKAALIAKQALLRDIMISDDSDKNTCSTSAHGNFACDASCNNVSAQADWRAETEARLLQRINALNIGPAGFGGKTTALAVHINTYPTHIAGLPVAVNIGCHVTRHKTKIL